MKFRWQVFLSPVYRRINGGSERLGNLPKTTQREVRESGFKFGSDCRVGAASVEQGSFLCCPLPNLCVCVCVG